MDSVIKDLALDLKSRLDALTDGSRLLVGISGFPASGKSTLAQVVAQEFNQIYGKHVATVVGLDGWHFSRAHLDTMPDPALAHARRGAHWTFDGLGYVAFARSLLSEEADTESCWAPSFDHSLKDPMERDVEVKPEHRVVLLEGLYTFLNVEPWVEAAQLLQERWYVEVDEKEAEGRLARRHIKSGICADIPSALARANENDLPSASSFN